MDWGDVEAKILMVAGEDAKLPFMSTKVVRDPHLEFEWAAFIDLSNDRQTGTALGPLAWSSIDRFAQRHGLEGDEFDRFARLIREMDVAYLNWHHRRMEEAKS